MAAVSETAAPQADEPELESGKPEERAVEAENPPTVEDPPVDEPLESPLRSSESVCEPTTAVAAAAGPSPTTTSDVDVEKLTVDARTFEDMLKTVHPPPRGDRLRSSSVITTSEPARATSPPPIKVADHCDVMSIM
jgi:hypothetical protein